MLKVVSDLVVSVIRKWNKLHIDVRNFTSINIFKKSLLQFVRPSSKRLCNCHSHKDIKYEVRSQHGLNHLWEHKFKHSFKDTVNPFCDCVCEIETKAHFHLHCPQFYTEPNTLLSKIEGIDTSLLNFWRSF